MTKEYTHAELGQEVRSITGYYIPEREEKLKYKGKEVLYVFGAAVVDNSCCGAGGCGYALVPGYLVKWKTKKDKEGLPISEVEPIRDDAARQEIATIIKKKENVNDINFL
jgi:hypothetical protein